MKKNIDQIGDLIKLADVRLRVAQGAQARAEQDYNRAKKDHQDAINVARKTRENAEETRQTMRAKALDAPTTLSQVARISLTYQIGEEDIAEADRAVTAYRVREGEALEILRMKQRELAQRLRNMEKLSQVAHDQVIENQSILELLEEFETESTT